MFQAIHIAAGVWHQVAKLSELTGLSVGVLAGLAGLVYLDPRLLKPALIAAAGAIAIYGSVLYGDRMGYVDGRAAGRAEIQRQWDAARAADADARAREKQAQAEAAARQEQADQAKAGELSKQTSDALAAIAAQADARRALLDSWRRTRKLRGIK